MVLAALSGCAHSTVKNTHANTPPIFQNSPERTSEIVTLAKTLLDIEYKYGSDDPAAGLDCSGLVRYVFKEAWGTELPRTSRAISRKGIHVKRQNLQPGDLVFFNTRKRKFSHVGIFLGNGRFIHAPSAGGQVRIEALTESYWRKRYNGARRLKDPNA